MNKKSFRRIRPGFSEWLFAALAFASFVAGAQTVNTNPPAPRRPGIIFIVADGLNQGDLGCYGGTKIKTPNLDQMAGEGIRFTGFYAGSPLSVPSRAALMTGRDSGHTGIRGDGQALAAGDVTVAEILKGAGYRTGLIGEWLLGDQNSTGAPDKKGFDEFVGYLNSTQAQDYFAGHLWRHAPASHFDGAMVFSQNQGGNKGLYIPELFTTAAQNFVRINKPDSFNKYRPFFLCLAYNLPNGTNENRVKELDDYVGRLIAKLKEQKMDTNTAVFFLSGNGPVKGDLREGGIRAPLIVRWPAGIKPGGVSDLICADWDLLATACEIAYLKPPQKTDGVSMLPVLLGQAQTNRHDFLYWETRDANLKQAVRMGDWKAIRSGADGVLGLYNLKTDPGEKQNVADKNTDVVAKIEKYLKDGRR